MTKRVQERREAERLLSATGVRVTPQRLLVLAELVRETDDVTAQELHDRLRRRGSRLGLATVYRTLGLLEGEGLVHAIPHQPGELCYRLCGEGHHHHLVCSRCHRVVEIAECELDPWLQRVSADHGFVPTGHRLEVAGLCGECRAA
ncbi:MAG: Fur family transcriptional regulator [Gaiellaceae bacterium]